MGKGITVILLCLLFSASAAWADPGHLDFTLHPLGSGEAGNTLLIFGGIQGDEPGGFTAASLLASHYTITKGSVWVVPNLNFSSIVKNSRGIYGDMNRKFAQIQADDPDLHAITAVKSLIQDPRVDMVLNLHDGSGFYRSEYIDKMHCPRRWGQSVIIDQEYLDAPHGDLLGLAQNIAARTNQGLLDQAHIFHVKNTETRLGDHEMEKTLTYFAICHNKPAFGLETSKSLPTAQRVYYQLHMLEAFMDAMGIEYQRRFQLTTQEVEKAINSNLAMALFGNKIFLDLQDVRTKLGYVPLQKNAEIAFSASNPILTLVGDKGGYMVYDGNRQLTRLQPQYYDYDYSTEAMVLRLDGEIKVVRFGDMVTVHREFAVVSEPDYRVNVIGFTKKGLTDDADQFIGRTALDKKFSVDKAGYVYRVEVYRDDKFTGMMLVNFDSTRDKPDTAYSRRISEYTPKSKGFVNPAPPAPILSR